MKSDKDKLRKKMGVAAGKKFPISKLKKAANSKDPDMRKMGQGAMKPKASKSC